MENERSLPFTAFKIIHTHTHTHTHTKADVIESQVSNILRGLSIKLGKLPKVLARAGKRQ